jgi:prepilin-type N-terminal cleavage/methylation domain-containing protein
MPNIKVGILMKRFISSRRAGFSLIELLIALMVMSIAIASFVPASITGRQIVARNRHKELAVAVASSVIDQERSYGYYNLAVGTTGLPANVAQPDLPNFNGSVTIAYVDSKLKATGSDIGRKRIDVTVSWSDNRKDKGAITVTSVVASE